MTIEDALLGALPVFRRQQVCVVLQEILLHFRIAEQEGAELLGEHIIFRDRVPRLAGHLVFFVARCRDFAEVAVGDVFDFVVVVEHHAAVLGHAEIFVEHVAGENIHAHHVLDRIAIFEDGVFHRRMVAALFRFAQPDVQRHHAALDVEVPDDDLIALFFHHRRRDFLQVGQQLVVEARTREGDVRIFERVGHAPDAIMVLHQQVFFLDDGARRFLRRGIEILDHLEHIREGRQREHHHHQAANAGRRLEAVGGMAQVVQVVAIERGLAQLLQTENGIDLAARLVRHERAQEMHVGRRHFHVDHEIGAREREQYRDQRRVEQHRIEYQLAAAVVQDGNDERIDAITVDALADDVRTLVAVEQAGQHLDLVIRFQQLVAEHCAHARLDETDVAVEISEGAVELEVGDDALQGEAQAVGGRVIHAVSRQPFFGLDVFGRYRRPHKDEIVVEIGAVQDVATHRIEKGFRQLRLLVVDEQADVMQLHFAPDFIIDFGRVVLVFQQLHAFLHAGIVERDALARLRLRRLPVGLLEIALCILAGGAEQMVVLVETVQHGARDIERDLGFQEFGKGGLRHDQALGRVFQSASVAKSPSMPPHIASGPAFA